MTQLPARIEPSTEPSTGAAPHEPDLALLDAWWRAANYLSVGQTTC